MAAAQHRISSPKPNEPTEFKKWQNKTNESLYNSIEEFSATLEKSLNPDYYIMEEDEFVFWLRVVMELLSDNVEALTVKAATVEKTGLSYDLVEKWLKRENVPSDLAQRNGILQMCLITIKSADIQIPNLLRALRLV